MFPGAYFSIKFYNSSFPLLVGIQYIPANYLVPMRNTAGSSHRYKDNQYLFNDLPRSSNEGKAENIAGILFETL